MIFVFFFIKVLLFYIVLITIAAYLSLFERKLIGRIQRRYGPRYCGKWGLLQPIADGLKLFFKQEALVSHSVISIFACALLLFASLLQFAFLPLGNITLLTSDYGLLYILAIHMIINFSELLIGITSNSKYGLIGGTRTLYQKMGADLPFILIILCIYKHNHSFNIASISQVANITSWILIPIWFIICLISTNRIPFDLIEAESDLVAGAYTEYGGILFGMIYLSDYLNVLFNSLLLSVLILPLELLSIGVTISISTIVLIRAILPRVLQIQMIKFSWKVLIPTLCLLTIFTRS